MGAFAKYTVLLFVLFFCFVSTLPAGVVYYGSVTDPNGDATDDDLVFGSISVDDASMATFLVRFEPSTFLAAIP